MITIAVGDSIGLEWRREDGRMCLVLIRAPAIGATVEEYVTDADGSVPFMHTSREWVDQDDMP